MVDRDAYLLAVFRYVERHSVAAGMVAVREDRSWSNCRAHLGQVATPEWLDGGGLHGHLLGTTVAGAPERRRAARLCAELVGRAQDGDALLWQKALRGQVYVGDEAFAARMQKQAEPERVARKGNHKSAVPAAADFARLLGAMRGQPRRGTAQRLS